MLLVLTRHRLSTLTPLRTRMRFQVGTTQHRSMTIRIDEGGVRLRYWLLLIIGLAILPIGVVIHHFSFESRRWADSDFRSTE